VSALVFNDGTFFCGGNLVSNQKVVTGEFSSFLNVYFGYALETSTMGWMLGIHYHMGRMFDIS